jgi:hypothetical protein
MRTTLLAALLLFICQSKFYSQIKTENRIEFELKEGYENFDLHEFGEYGILVFYRAEKAQGGMIEWKVDHYSTDLKLIDSKEFKVTDDFYLRKSEADKDFLYLLFSSRKGPIQLVQIGAESLKQKSYTFETPSKAYSYEFLLNEDMAYMAFTSKKALTLKRIDLKSGKDTDIPVTIAGFKPNGLVFENFQVDEDSKELYLFVNAYVKKVLNLHVLRYSPEGKLTETISMSQDVEKTLTSISASYLREGEYLYTGTYSSYKKAGGNTSEGIYICKTTNGSKDFIKFYNFTEFDEFLNYLSDKRQEKIEKKKEKAEAKGKEFVINYRMSSHNIRFMDGKFIYIGEAYYPTYRTETYTTYVNGQAVTQTRQVFDGYQYTHATVAAFDIEGTKLWDKTFEMYPGYKPYNVIRFIRVTETSDTELGLMFSSYRTIKSKAISTEGEVLNEREVSSIETGNEEDKIKSSFSNLTFWYDNYFLAHGTQTIKNKDEKEERGKAKRRVYFINKISYTF